MINIDITKQFAVVRITASIKVILGSYNHKHIAEGALDYFKRQQPEADHAIINRQKWDTLHVTP